jgi:hypothetical protein
MHVYPHTNKEKAFAVACGHRMCFECRGVLTWGCVECACVYTLGYIYTRIFIRALCTMACSHVHVVNLPICGNKKPLSACGHTHTHKHTHTHTHTGKRNERVQPPDS